LVARSVLALAMMLLAVALWTQRTAAMMPVNQGWWQTPAVQRQLGLSTAQVRSLESIYRRSLPERRRLRRRQYELDRQLTRLLADGASSDDRASALIDRVVDARRRSNVARTLVLVRMYRILDPQQQTRLASLAPVVRD
jgi:Spy/CpxP family protein refolding chaperone